MKRIESNKKKVLQTIIYIYTFFVIYMPRVSDLVWNIPTEIISVIILGLAIIPWVLIYHKKQLRYKVNKQIFYLITGILISALYFAIRALIESNEMRILQNIFIIVQIIHIVIIIDFMKFVGYRKAEMIRVLLNLALFQGLISIFMLIFPEFKQVALKLYYLGREENIFISRMRIYGISGDYTYFTPIYHAMLAVIAFYHAVYKNIKYGIYIPFILLVMFLNGRFGLLIFIIGIFIGPVYILFKNKLSKKLTMYIILSIVLLFIGVLSLNIFSPYTYKWVISGFKDTLNFLSNNQYTGNFKVLADTMLYFPKGLGIIFGEGHRVYSFHGSTRGYNSSDIGYVNDLFMGGIIYMLILYGTVFNFMLKNKRTSPLDSKADTYLNKIISILLVSSLVISNYKGESMRGGTIIVGAIFIKLIFMQPTQVSLVIKH